MKIEQLIVQYLYLNKKVTLEHIGTFHLSQDVTFQSDNEQPAVLPPNAIQYEFNIKAGHDEGLIKFVVEKTRKIKPLAISDLESFSILGKQFLNLGKPFIIKDLGLLYKNQNNEYEFTQTQTVATKQEAAPAAVDVTNKEPINEIETDLDFTTPAPVVSNKKWLVPVIVFFVIIVAIVAVYSKFNKSSKNEEVVQVSPEPATTTSAPVSEPVVPAPTVQDTATITKDTIATAQPLPTPKPKDTVTPKPVTPPPPPPAPVVVPTKTFKVVVREYTDLESAQKGYNALTKFPFGKNLIMYTKDSTTYRLAVKVTGLVKDIPKIKDSVKGLFGKTAIIDMN